MSIRIEYYDIVHESLFMQVQITSQNSRKLSNELQLTYSIAASYRVVIHHRKYCTKLTNIAF